MQNLSNAKLQTRNCKYNTTGKLLTFKRAVCVCVRARVCVCVCAVCVCVCVSSDSCVEFFLLFVFAHSLQDRSTCGRALLPSTVTQS